MAQRLTAYRLLITFYVHDTGNAIDNAAGNAQSELVERMYSNLNC